MYCQCCTSCLHTNTTDVTRHIVGPTYVVSHTPLPVLQKCLRDATAIYRSVRDLLTAGKEQKSTSIDRRRKFLPKDSILYALISGMNCHKVNSNVR